MNLIEMLQQTKHGKIYNIFPFVNQFQIDLSTKNNPDTHSCTGPAALYCTWCPKITRNVLARPG